VLEENAHNTYDNIKFSSEILKEKKWRNAILVSSPYNMLRASLVSKKIAPGIHFIYAPIPYSIFYGDGNTIHLKHIFAILHEYTGIVYYWFKGYI